MACASLHDNASRLFFPKKKKISKIPPLNSNLPLKLGIMPRHVAAAFVRNQYLSQLFKLQQQRGAGYFVLGRLPVSANSLRKESPRCR